MSRNAFFKTLVALCTLVPVACTPSHRARATCAEEEYAIVATLLQIDGAMPGNTAYVAVDPDPRFEMLLRVDQVVSGKSPYSAGQIFILFIHSPTLTYVEQPPLGSRHRYHFRTECVGPVSHPRLTSVDRLEP
jgi:hypothetical protein